MLKNKNIAAQEKQDASSTLHLPLHITPEQAVRQKSAASIYQHMVRDAATVSPYDIRGLQSTVGNQAIQRLLAVTIQYQVAQRAELTHPQESVTALPPTLKSGIENLSGLSMDDVHVHYNSAKPAQVQALAYTQGTEIHMGPGQEQHLAHEAWHVVQQKQGRVKPTRQAKAVSINDDAGLEREADIMGSRAKRAEGGDAHQKKNVSLPASDTLQRKVDHEGLESLANFQEMKFYAALNDEEKSLFEAYLRRRENWSLTVFLTEIGKGDIENPREIIARARPSSMLAPRRKAKEEEPIERVNLHDAIARVDPRQNFDDFFQQVRKLSAQPPNKQELYNHWKAQQKARDEVPVAANVVIAAPVPVQATTFAWNGVNVTRAALIDHIKAVLPANGHKNISQAMNDLDDKGKATTGHPDVLHASAGKEDANGGCTLFFTRNNGQVNIIGVGQHAGIKGEVSYYIYFGNAKFGNKLVL